ncbi:glycosyltransferase [Phenylobacterium immobile]|uniref:glycosyltransferase n=1 Tax=Phenylobacterium immobile TaxID=21 RepID=UPI000B155C7C|nr:glycosyltransferase [Phenylobacterium immobile]
MNSQRTILVVCDVIGATQTINFSGPLAQPVAAGEIALHMVASADLPKAWGETQAAWWRGIGPSVLVLSRYSDGEHQSLIDLAHANGVPVIYHLDDDLLAVPETLGPEKHAHYNQPRRLRDLRAAIEASDLVYASTPYLAERLKVIHRISRPILTAEIACGLDPSILSTHSVRTRPVIGYMATSGHGRDLERMTPGIIEALEAMPDLTFEIFGTLAAPADLRRAYGDRIVHRPAVTDYDAFLATLSSLGWWLGLASLEDTDFNRCKTETKWVEYTCAGIPTVASNIEVYRRCCGADAGVIVPDDSLWGAVILKVLQGRQLRETLARAAQAKARDLYAHDRMRGQLERLFATADVVARARPVVSRPPTSPTPPPGPRPKEYDRWIAAHDGLGETDRARIIAALDRRETPAPLVSVVLLASEAGVPPALVERSLASLHAQIHRRWQVIAPAGSVPAGLQEDPLLVLAPGADLPAGLDAASGEFVTFLEAGDELAPHALFHLVSAAEAAGGKGGADFIYSDEDEIDASAERRRRNPFFKGAWDPDLFLAQDYACRAVLLPRTSALAVAEGAIAPSSVYKLLLRLTGQRGAPRVERLPLVLYHRLAGRETPGAEREAMLQAAQAALAGPAQVEGAGSVRRVIWPLPRKPPRVSLVIPTRDRADLLKTCVESVLTDTDYDDLEVLILDNDSRDPEAVACLEALGRRPKHRVISVPGPFNYSAINNLGVGHATGSVIGLLNNDIRVIEPGWLKAMVAQVVRPEAGAVGALLYYEDYTVQHAGVVLGVGGAASHLFKRQPQTSAGYHDSMLVAHQVSAVTAACMLVRRDTWDAVGGLDEALAVAFNDIDLCLRIGALDKRIVWTPLARLLHLESASRGREESPAKRARLAAEIALMRARWGVLLESDPFFSPNLALNSVDCRPAFPPRYSPPWLRDA